MSTPPIASTVAEAQAAIRMAKKAGKRIGFVPTMGALHEGHLSLVHASRERCDFHVASIFVNPTQFGENEDLDRYPRTFESDVAKLADCQVDLIFAPTVTQMYPDGYSTFVDPPMVAKCLEGIHRPLHFRGVATVVLKLFLAVPADVAFFGEKDFQQCLVIQQMVRDLNVEIDVVPCPIVREPDGIAMSSRNRYLSNTERRRALSISRSLVVAKRAFDSGNRDVHSLENAILEQINDQVDSIDYAVVRNAHTLEPFSTTIDGSAVALIAVHVGSTRLIDNQRLS